MLNGVHPGFRTQHAKGVCVTGSFESMVRAASLSKAVVVPDAAPRAASLPVSAFAAAIPLCRLTEGRTRFGLSFLPLMAKSADANDQHSRFRPQDPKAFYEAAARHTSRPSKRQAGRVEESAFARPHPEFAVAMKVLTSNPFSSGFANAALQRPQCVPLRSLRPAAATPVRWSDGPDRAFRAGAA